MGNAWLSRLPISILFIILLGRMSVNRFSLLSIVCLSRHIVTFSNDILCAFIRIDRVTILSLYVFKFHMFDSVSVTIKTEIACKSFERISKKKMQQMHIICSLTYLRCRKSARALAWECVFVTVDLDRSYSCVAFFFFFFSIQCRYEYNIILPPSAQFQSFCKRQRKRKNAHRASVIGF